MHHHPPASRVRLIFSAAAAAVGGALAWWHWRSPWAAGVTCITSGLLLLALIAPRAYVPVYRVLDGIVRVLLQMITWLLLGSVFVSVFLPGRVLLALRGRDPLDRRRDVGRTTYWRDVPPATRDVAAYFRAQF